VVFVVNTMERKTGFLLWLETNNLAPLVGRDVGQARWTQTAAALLPGSRLPSVVCLYNIWQQIEAL